MNADERRLLEECKADLLYAKAAMADHGITWNCSYTVRWIDAALAQPDERAVTPVTSKMIEEAAAARSADSNYVAGFRSGYSAGQMGNEALLSAVSKRVGTREDYAEAYASPVAQPEQGWVSVPREPTSLMVTAGRAWYPATDDEMPAKEQRQIVRQIYSHMIAAAPK